MENEQLELSDIGGVIQDLNLSLFDILPEDDDREARYMKPKVPTIKKGFVRYNNAAKLAKALRLDKGERFDCIVGGNFIFGDLIEAYLVGHNAKAVKMTISTLTLAKQRGQPRQSVTGWLHRRTLPRSVYLLLRQRGARPHSLHLRKP